MSNLLYYKKLNVYLVEAHVSYSPYSALGEGGVGQRL